MLETAITDYGAALANAVLDPQKRLFVGYLLAALAIAVAVTALANRDGRRSGIAGAVRAIFSRSVWWSASSRADYLLSLLNQAVMMLLAPYLVTQLTLATALYFALYEAVGSRPLWGAALPGWAVMTAFTVVFFLVDDLFRYVLHRLMHRWPALWAFHKVHHTAESLTPFTVLRTHPVEGVLFSIRSAAAQAAVMAPFLFAFGDRVDLATVWGVNVLVFVFNVAGANLRHSHVSISYPRWLERILISPAQHQIHHSVAPHHHDRNFGVALAVWDWIGGSLCLSERGQTLQFGLGAEAPEDRNTLYGLYVRPLADCAQAVLAGTGRAARLVIGRKGETDMVRNSESNRHGAFGRLVTRRAGPAVLAAAVLASLASDSRAAEQLDIYSHRQPYLIEPFIDAYTAETGTQVNIVYASSGLAQRLLAEGERSPADLVLTVDIGRLRLYADKELLASVRSEVLTENIPAHLHAIDNTWFALSKRVRILAVSKDRVAEGAIQRLEELAEPEWEGRVCTRPGSHVYNRALMASMIAAHGEEGAEEWARGLVANLARRPQGDDRAQVKAIFEGECDVAIINHYYYGNLRTSDVPEHNQWAEAVRMVFPNQDDRGAHVNISGGGVAKHSDNKAEAIRFLEFLSNETAQKLYGTVNSEYPVNPAVEPAENVRELGDFKEDILPVERIAELSPLAQRVIDRVGW